VTRKKWQFEDTYAQSRSCASKYVALCTTTDLEYTHTQHRILTGSAIQAGQHGTKVTSLWLAFGRLNTCLCIYTFSGSDYRRSNCLKNSAATSHPYRNAGCRCPVQLRAFGTVTANNQKSLLEHLATPVYIRHWRRCGVSSSLLHLQSG